MAANLIPISSPPPPHSLFHHHHHTTNTKWSQIPLTRTNGEVRLTPIFSTSSPSSSSLVEEEENSLPSPSPSSSSSTQAGVRIENSDKLPFRGCKACRREEIEKGCNGEGRIQGGIATVPGFGWWPIKAYRPCPGFVEAGGRYRRSGQTMDEVAWGRTEREAPMVRIDEDQPSKKQEKS